MKIVFLARRFWPSIGGVETHVGEITKVLLEKGHEVTIIKEQDKSYSYNYQSKSLSAKYTGVEKIPKIYELSASGENWFKKFRVWKGIWAYRKIIKSADIVHCHDVFFWYLPLRILYHKKPVFTTFHGYETKVPPSHKAILVRKLSEKLSWGNICVGEFIKKWYGTKPGYITYGGVIMEKGVLEKGRQSVKNLAKNNGKYNLTKLVKKGKPIVKIGFVGRLEEDTGVLKFLDALRLLKNRNIKFEFTAIGDGSLRREVERWGVVTGYVNDLYSYIKNVHIAFGSSYLSILELLSTKNPVLAVYSNTLKRDYLTQSPFSQFISIKGSSKGIMNEILKIMKNPKVYRDRVEKGYEFTKTQSWDTVADLYLKLWSKK